MLLLTTLSLGWAGTCDTTLAKIPGLTTDTVVAGFTELARCNKEVATTNFNRYLEKATNTDVLVALSLAAVDQDIWTPVMGAIGKVKDYAARDEVTQRVGSACAEHPKVISFLESTYTQGREIEFQQWDDAYTSCTDTGLWSWMDTQVKNAPSSTFDEKYDVLLGLYVRTRKIDALPTLTEAAIKAGTSGGPFDSILAKMGEAAAPELGASISPENQKKLEDALVNIAKKVPSERARSVAVQLANSGSEAAAATLLPVIYADRMQNNGSFLYGAASIEAGECEGKKTAVIHYTTVTEPGKRWTILSDIEPLMRAFKAKLKGCTTEEPWVVLHSPEPLKSAGDVEAWLEGVSKEWADQHKDYKVSTQKEKGIAL
jgi:hypothetical protein